MATCPRCDIPLEATTYAGVDIESCTRCGGRWLDPDSLKAIVDTPEPAPSGGQPGVGVEPGRVNLASNQAKQDVRCPSCGEVMEPFNYAGDSGILLDKCQRCNHIWLDVGQLEDVRSAVAATRRDLERDVKRFSGDLEQVEVREDAMELQDNRTTPAPITTAIANRLLGE